MLALLHICKHDSSWILVNFSFFDENDIVMYFLRFLTTKVLVWYLTSFSTPALALPTVGLGSQMEISQYVDRSVDTQSYSITKLPPGNIYASITALSERSFPRVGLPRLRLKNQGRYNGCIYTRQSFFGQKWVVLIYGNPPPSTYSYESEIEEGPFWDNVTTPHLMKEMSQCYPRSPIRYHITAEQTKP